MVRRLCLGFGLILSAAAAQAGITVAGSVVDAALSPLAGTVITISCPATPPRTATTGADGRFTVPQVPAGVCQLRAEHAGYLVLARDIRLPENARRIQLPIVLTRASDNTPPTAPVAADIRMTGTPPPPGAGPVPPAGAARGAIMAMSERHGAPSHDTLWWPDFPIPPSGERYAHVEPNRFHSTSERPVSTFGADVDTASYTNVRRFLSMGRLPPPDAVRIEEFVNYFRFEYPGPRDGHPIGVTTEIGDCPWAPAHKLLLIGARAMPTAAREIAGRNIVLLIDVSGSMAPPERLPLIKSALGMFVDTLRADDRLAIVTYAGTSGVALPPTSVREREAIHRAIDRLSAGGSTNGGQGLILAYRLARQAYIPDGVNRVILATDGDFNVGIVDQRDLRRLIERERDSGVFLSVFGVGSGNLKDATMEMLADRGNGHYAYLDSLQEARRMLVREADATLETVAKDVKFQVAFNPSMVRAWKLIGYENRRLAARDFANDRKDAGDMGAGQTVTVLYEVVPAGAPRAGDWMTLSVRYKAPDDERSELLTHAGRPRARAEHLPFAAAVAEFGLLLRDNRADRARWEALSQRVADLEVPRALVSERDAFAELVAIAAGLSRR